MSWQTDHDRRMRRLIEVVEKDPGVLRRLSPSRYSSAYPAAFGNWLLRHGWIAEWKDPGQYQRFHGEDGEIIKLRKDGTVVVMGSHSAATHQFLAQLVKP
jgi:hypothetical protein